MSKHETIGCDTLSLDEINPEKNGGRFTPLSLAPGFDVVFLHQPGGTATVAATKTVRLFGDPLLEALEVTEVSEGGSVPFLKAVNNTTFDVLFIAGQLVKGGKQNRGLNADLLVNAGESARIPVTCVEQGRWSGGPRERFTHGGFEPTTIRTSKMRDVHLSRRGSGECAARQDAVWSEIADLSRAFGSDSRSSDLLHASRMRLSRSHPELEPIPRGVDRITYFEGRRHELRGAAQSLLASANDMLQAGNLERLAALRRDLDHTLRELTLVDRELERLRAAPAANGTDAFVPADRIAKANEAALGASGMLVFFNGEFLAGDIFGKPDWFATMYGDLRDSALLSWEHCMTRRRDRAINPLASSIAASSARTIVQEACQGHWIDRPAVAHGRSQLLEHAYLDGAVLRGRDGAPLHVLVGTKSTPEFVRRG